MSLFFKFIIFIFIFISTTIVNIEKYVHTNPISLKFVRNKNIIKTQKKISRLNFSHALETWCKYN